MKQVLFLISLTFFSFNLCAQNIDFGVRGGLNFANLKFSGTETEIKSVTRFHLGVLAEYSFSEKLSIQPEIIFNTGGVKEEIGSSTFIAKTSNISIPVLVKYKVADKLSLEAGPVYNLLLSIKLSDGNEQNFEDIKEFYKTGSFAFAFGAEYELEQLLAGLRAGIRYQLGLSDINSEEINGVSAKANSLFFTFSYRFDLKSKEQ